MNNGAVASEESGSELVWVKSRYPVLNLGLAHTLQGAFRVHHGEEPPDSDACHYVLVCADSREDLFSSLEFARERYSGAKLVIFSLTMDLALAREALRSGARGFIHGEMHPEQVRHAMYAVRKGELAAPRELLGFLFQDANTANTKGLTTRQQEVLGLAADGLSNLQIAQRLYLSESSVKQHLRAAFKLLGVKSRTEAARVLRDS